ncbi:MAG: glycosyltransferase family 2 protein [Pseudomonadales bacterium]|nr:glycosyltransferase family 2 protein [Pseudomonadales bacterium]
MKKKLFFSIVIPTLNEEKFLPGILSDLTKQTNTDFEVIHVDGNSDDKSVAIATEFAKKIKITSKIVNVRNVSYQRNEGISLSKGRWIIFMDADNRIDPSFLDGIKYRLSQNKSTDLFTTWISINESKTINKPVERTINLGLELFKLIGKEWSLGALIGVKTSIANKHKFDEKQKVGEDGLFVKALINQGYNFNIFRDPKYHYSLRRLETEGSIKFARAGAKVALNYLQGKDFSEDDFGYKMNGGTYYDQKNYISISKLPEYIKSLPRKQYIKAKKLFKTLSDIGL